MAAVVYIAAGRLIANAAVFAFFMTIVAYIIAGGLIANAAVLAFL